MPNDITTEIHAKKEVIDATLSPNGRVDFNNLIPMQADVYRGNLSAEMQERYPGEANWYGWSIAHWGTKWNGYDAERKAPGILRFDTAWAHPFPVIKALSMRFPEEKILVLYADEDIGSNYGLYAITNGVSENLDFDSIAGRTIANEFCYRVKWGTSQTDDIESEIKDFENEYDVSLSKPISLIALLKDHAQITKGRK